jgi:hypothetical protein
MVVGMKDCTPAVRELKVFVEEESIASNFLTEVWYASILPIKLQTQKHFGYSC